MKIAHIKEILGKTAPFQISSTTKETYQNKNPGVSHNFSPPDSAQNQNSSSNNQQQQSSNIKTTRTAERASRNKKK
jgi:hypothetical protein